MKTQLAAAVLGMAMLAPLGAQQSMSLGETNPLSVLIGNRFDGSWWMTVPPGTPAQLQMTRTGNFTINTASDYGGFLPFELSEIRGIWRRMGARKAEGVGVRFTIAPDGTISLVVRAKVKLELSSDFQSLKGEVTFEQLNCETVQNPMNPERSFPSCPDVTSALADSVRGPVPFSAKRTTFSAGQ